MRRTQLSNEPDIQYQLTVDAVSLELNGASIFSKLDLSQVYHQLELSPTSRHTTTFCNDVGLYRYKRLNYRTNAAAELFQHSLQETLQGIKGIENIADDIVVFGNPREDHNRASLVYKNITLHLISRNASS